MYLFASNPFPIPVHVCMLSVAKYFLYMTINFVFLYSFKFSHCLALRLKVIRYFFGFTVFIKYPSLQGQKAGDHPLCLLLPQSYSLSIAKSCQYFLNWPLLYESVQQSSSDPCMSDRKNVLTSYFDTVPSIIPFQSYPPPICIPYYPP